MEKLQIKNLRNLVDTGEVHLKPITVLVGKNGSGKSSFLRFFPLLKQSAETKTRGPLLWNGDYVDYGNFNEAVNRDAREDDPAIVFKMFYNLEIEEPLLFNQDVEMELHFKYKHDNEKVYCSKMLIGVDGNVIKLTMDGNLVKEFVVNSIDILNAEGKSCVYEQDDFIPTIDVRYASHSLINCNNPQLFQKTLSRILKNGGMCCDVFIDLLCKSKEYYINIANSIKYIHPLRAGAERYYRNQDLAVYEIDPKGNNLAMFLRNVSAQELKEFQLWARSNFNFDVHIKTTEGHTAIEIKEGLSRSYNLADMGFGYSQILPVIVSLWSTLSIHNLKRVSSSYASSNGARQIPLFYVIEQPELHLHPDYQAKIADILVSSIQKARENKIDLRIIVETHSEHIINRLGSLVYEKKITDDDVNAVLFDRKDDGNGPGKVEVKQVSFDVDGVLQDWPFGFFLPEDG